MAPSLSLILRQTVQAVLLSGIANTLAQLIQITRSPIHQSFNFQRLLQYLIFVVLNTPPNILWQAFLEDCFPGTTMQPHVRHYQRSTRAEDFSDLKEPSPLEDEKGEYERKAAKQDLAKWEDDKKQWTEEVKLEPRFDVKNTAWKFALDQTIGALVNTVIFVAGMAGLRGEGWKSAIDHIRLDTGPLMIAGLKFWPLVSILSFTLIPPNQRVIFGSLMGMGWGIFLSLFIGH